MTYEPNALRAEWMRLRASEKGLHALELAERLEVSECQLLASACGAIEPVSAIRLEASWPELIAKLPKLGHVKTVTRNPHAVIEVEGTYDNIEFFGAMGQSVSSIDLRFFVSRWAHGFAVREETRRGISRGLQFFDKTGRAIHKLYLRDTSDTAFFDALVRDNASSDQSARQAVEPAPLAPTPRRDEEIDLVGLREAWLAMKDTHEFFGLLRKFDVARTQAFRLIGDDLARGVERDSLEKVLYAAAGTELPFMTFVGNPGIVQIFTGTIAKVAPMGPWINVLDPGFDLHVRQDRIDSAWVVRKPTADGVVTALELYDAEGEQIALLVGKRKPGQQENAAWRALVEGLRSSARVPGATS
ncbi:MAG: hemin-degrading factor [Labilithrix sp.]|nr:hemin-degrading factor [Labilithrix sp.]